MSNSYPNGLAEATPPILGNDLRMSGAVWYLDATNGSDDAGWGTDREKPLATLAQAQTNASDNDVIVCLDGHAETLTAVLALTKILTIIGEGGTTGSPSVIFTLDNGSNASLFTIGVARFGFHNIQFATNSQTNTAARISVAGAGFWMNGCYFDCSGTDTGAGLSLGSGADDACIEDTYFVSSATAIATQPSSGLKVAAAVSNLKLNGNVFSDGTAGFSTGYALHASTAAITGLRGANNSLLLGASATIHASTVGYLGIGAKTGSPRVVF